eukprot:superscaffoldBa00000843_g7555
MLFILLGDEAFPLCRHLLCPFPGSNITKKDSIYNYGLSCARLADSKWSFRILSSLSKMYRRVIEVGPDKVEHYVKATYVLHSVFLRESAMRDNHRAATQQLAVQPPALCDVCRTSHNNATREALKEIKHRKSIKRKARWRMEGEPPRRLTCFALPVTGRSWQSPPGGSGCLTGSSWHKPA